MPGGNSQAAPPAQLRPGNAFLCASARSNLTTLCRWSGLIRGAVSVALVYYHFDPQGKSEDAKRATLITTTLLVVLFSILVCGALTKPLLQLLLEPQGFSVALSRLLVSFGW